MIARVSGGKAGTCGDNATGTKNDTPDAESRAAQRPSRGEDRRTNGLTREATGPFHPVNSGLMGWTPIGPQQQANLRAVL